jgi:geranylgeranyl pyrophosphate synthase
LKENSEENIEEQILKLLRKKGRNCVELAKKEVLNEKIETKEVTEALKYFITEYWNDFTRPALLSLISEAVGGESKKVTPIAVSLTLIAGAIDIHDDIIDQSEKKGEKYTVFGKFGKNIALLVGDALLFKGFTVLYESLNKGVKSEQIFAICRIIKNTFFELGDAESLELAFRNRIDITPEDYLHVVKKKAADVEAYTKIGALIGGGSQKEIKQFGEYGRLLGMLVILRDDIIDMFDSEETIHRIKKEHISLPLIYALQNQKIKKKILNSIKEIKKSEDAKKLSILINDAGGFELLNQCMENIAKAAINKIKLIKFNKNELKLLIQGMLIPDWASYL